MGKKKTLKEWDERRKKQQYRQEKEIGACPVSILHLSLEVEELLYYTWMQI